MIPGRMAAIVVVSSIAFLLMVGTVAVRAASPTLLRRLESRDPIWRANHLFLLRVLPTAMALFVSCVVILPVFLWLEPTDSHERIPATMIVAAGCGCLLLLSRVANGSRAVGHAPTDADVAGTRAIGRSASTRRLPAYSIDDEFPTVAVVGMRRADAVHVRARPPGVHRRGDARDDSSRVRTVEATTTLRRLVLRACPDLFDCARALDRAWESASEEAADARSPGRRRSLALSLAQALVRVGPSGARAARRLCERPLFRRQHRSQGPSAVVAARIAFGASPPKDALVVPIGRRRCAGCGLRRVRARDPSDHRDARRHACPDLRPLVVGPAAPVHFLSCGSAASASLQARPYLAVTGLTKTYGRSSRSTMCR